MPGTALYFEEQKLKYSAYYADGMRFKRKAPDDSSKKIFTEFSTTPWFKDAIWTYLKLKTRKNFN